ncbi:MAG: SurA N-terminal domain-containing protein [Candidatus Omnitrophota bacterium]|jgi:peptidyl-prolyl cis-trans isomerase D
MLKLFRKKIVSKIILWGLLILILPAFVMWGSASMSRSKDKGPTYVGIFDNRKVSFEQLYQAISGVRSQIILSYYNQPQILEALLNNKPMLAKIGWDRILMLEEAKKLRLKALDSEVIATIRSHPLFMRDGTFDEKFYSYILRNNIGLDPRAFEEIVRENILIQKLSAYVTRNLKVTDADVVTEYNKEFSKFKISYVVFDVKDHIDEAKVDEKAVSDFYEKHKNELMLKSNLKGAIPDRAATFDESRESIEKFLKEVEARKTLKDKSLDIYNKIVELMEKKNATFEKAASELKLKTAASDFFSRSDKIDDIESVPMIANEAAGLKIFEVSKPVEINKGFMIFEVVQKKEPDEEAFKKEKDEYVKKVRAKMADSLMESYLRDLESKATLAIQLDDVEKYYR